MSHGIVIHGQYELKTWADCITYRLPTMMQTVSRLFIV